MKNHSHIEKNKNDTIRLSSRNNLPEASEKMKKILEERRIGSDGKRIHKNIENKNNMKEKKKDYKKNYDYSSDYDDRDSFIDDNDESLNSEVKDYFIKMDKKHKIQKKHEYKGDIIESNYDYIQKEEKYSRYIGRKEDEEAAKYNKEHEHDEDDDDEDEEY